MLALLLLAAAPDTPASAPPPPAAPRAFNTDRPDKTESPYTVDSGRFQVEADVATYTIDRAEGVRTRTINLAPTNLKYGIADHADVQLVFDAYVHQETSDAVAGTRARVEGIGDVTLRLKRNLWGDDGGSTAFALMPFVKLPTASHSIGNGDVEGGLIAPLAVALSERVGLGLMTEVDLLRTEEDDRTVATFVNSATLGIDLTERLGLYGEVYTEIGAASGSRLVATVDTGVTYAIGANLQLDMGANVGVTDAADDLAVFLGVSRRF